MRIFTISIFLAITLSSIPVFADYLPEESGAEATIPTVERVEAFLESERYILSRVELRKLTDDVVADLISIAKRRSARSQTRARAVESLGLYPDDARGVETIQELFEKSQPGQKLFEVLLVTHVQVGGADATESAIYYLDHEDVSVRRSVVVALGRFGGQLAFELLKARKATEPDPRLKQLISTYVD